MPDEPLSYWVSVARMGFEDDFNRLFEELDISQAQLAKRVNPPVSEAYVSKLLKGTAGNYELHTMAKWARAVGGIVQIRIIKEDGEVVRVVDYETAGVLDDLKAADASEDIPSISVATSSAPSSASVTGDLASVSDLLKYRARRGSTSTVTRSASEEQSIDAVFQEASHG